MDGRVADRLAAEHPGLGLVTATVAARPRRSPADIRARLAALADRWRGPQALALRHEPLAHAHRVFFRHVGIDPDVQRIPQEEAVVRRLVDGGFPARGLPQDALTIAAVELGVGVWALDADRVEGELALDLDDAETIVVADRVAPIAPLFGDPGRAAVSRRTRTTLLYAIRVPGIPPLFAQEAVDLCVELLDAEE